MRNYRTALNHIENKDYCEALEVLNDLIEENPNFFGYYLSLTYACVSLNIQTKEYCEKNFTNDQVSRLNDLSKDLKKLIFQNKSRQKVSFCIPVKNRSKVSVEWNGVSRKKTFVTSYKDKPLRLDLFLLKNCVQSIFNSSVDEVDFEVVIVDFESTDDPPMKWASALSSPGVDIKIVEVKEPFSRGRGLNIAAENASGTVLFFLDADMLVSKELIYQALRVNLIERKAFFPICYSYLTPFHKEGWVRSEGWGNLSISREMYESKKIQWWEKKSWGSEDDHMRDCLEGFYSRKKGIEFFHQWHPEDDFKTKHYEQKKNKFDIVLGVTTYNRLDYLMDFVNSWMSTRNPYYKWTLIFSDDGSTDGTLEYLESLEIDNCKIYIIRHNRTGVHESTNSILDRCLSINFDYGFKCDDDVVFLQKGWDDRYIEGMDVHPYICNYNTGWRKASPRKINDKFVSYSDAYYSQGAFWTFTKKVLAKVGWFDTKTFGYKGYGHIDYSVRACRAGFNDFSTFVDIKNSNEFIGLQAEDYKPALTEREISVDFGLVVDEEKKRAMNELIVERRSNVIYVKRDAIYSYEACKTKPLIHFIIHNNHIGGAEYVHFNHALALRSLGFDIKVWSVGDGDFFNKFAGSDFSISHVANLFDDESDDWKRFENSVLDGNYVYNCNAYNDDRFQHLSKRKFIYYFTILHSDVDWIITHHNKYKYFTYKFIGIHQNIKEALIESGVGPEKISVVHNTLEPGFPFGKNEINNFTLREFYGIDRDAIVVGFVGRIAQDKNILDLIEISDLVLTKSEKFKFVVVGGKSARTADQGYNDEVQRKIQSAKNKEGIIYLGERSGDELYAALDLIDVAINVSPSEGLPISMLEQLAKGIYCIYPDFPEISRVLSKFKSVTVNVRQRKDAKNLRYTEDEKKGFVDAILNLDKASLNGIVKYNVQSAKDSFSHERCGKSLSGAFC